MDILAHAGHPHEVAAPPGIEDSTPLLLASLVVAGILFGISIYFLSQWQTRSRAAKRKSD